MQTLINKFKSLPVVVRGIIIIFPLLSFAFIILVWSFILNIAQQVSIPTKSPVIDVSSSQTSFNTSVSPQPIKEQETLNPPPQEELSSQITQEEQKEDNPYIALSKDTDSYLLLLKVIGECYIDNSLSQESLEVMQSNSAVAPLVEDILDYKYESNSLSPDFSESFSLFWNEDIAQQHEEVAKSLSNSFDLGYNVLEKKWTITPQNDTGTSSESDAQFEWLTASSHLFTGVELYIVTDTTTTLYGFVEEIGKNEILVYLEAAEKAEWFERRTPLFMKVLKVRSDDPNLP